MNGERQTSDFEQAPEPEVFTKGELADVFLARARSTQELMDPTVVKGFLDMLLANKLPSVDEASKTIEQASLLGKFTTEKELYELFSDQPLENNA